MLVFDVSEYHEDMPSWKKFEDEEDRFYVVFTVDTTQITTPHNTNTYHTDTGNSSIITNIQTCPRRRHRRR